MTTRRKALEDFWILGDTKLSSTYWDLKFTIYELRFGTWDLGPGILKSSLARKVRNVALGNHFITPIICGKKYQEKKSDNPLIKTATYFSKDLNFYSLITYYL